MVWESQNCKIFPKEQNIQGGSSLPQLLSTFRSSTGTRSCFASAGLMYESSGAVTTATTTKTAVAETVVHFVEHKVQKGDWLYEISRHHNVDFRTILDANPTLTNPDNLRVGSVIKIPQVTSEIQGMSSARYQPDMEGSSFTKPATSVATWPETATLSKIFFLANLVLFKGRKHRVVEGDCLEGIAEKYDTSVSAIKTLNNLDDDVIHIDSILNIDNGGLHKKHQSLFGEKASIHERNTILEHALGDMPQIAQASSLANPLFYLYPLLQKGKGAKSPAPKLITIKVKYGDTLAQISCEHGLSIRELQQLNNLKDDVIIEGDVLAISAVPVKKEPLELRQGRRRTNRFLFSRQFLLKGSSLGIGGPESTVKAQTVSSDSKREGKWKHVKKGFQQRNQSMHFGAPLRDGYISSSFGWRWGAFHEGVDVAAEHGTAILASEKGTVTFAGWNGGYGYLVAIEHEGGFVTRYAHCCAIHARVGQQVQKGQEVAAVGATGRATGPHLHFEVRRNGEAMDPLKWVNL